MAKVVSIETAPQAIGAKWSIWKVLLVGIASAIIYFGLAFLIEKYLINYFFCQVPTTALVCLNTFEVAGNISLIIVALLEVVIMLRLGIMRPLIVAVATGAALWGLSGWVSGLAWYEMIGWGVLLFVISLGLFSWISRLRQTMLVLLFTALIVAIIRVMLVL